MAIPFINQGDKTFVKKIITGIVPPKKPPGLGFGGNNFKPRGNWGFGRGLLLGIALDLLFASPANEGEDEFLAQYKPRDSVTIQKQIPAPFSGGQSPGVSYTVYFKQNYNGANPAHNGGLFQTTQIGAIGKILGIQSTLTGNKVYWDNDNFSYPPSHDQYVAELVSQGGAKRDTLVYYSGLSQDETVVIDHIVRQDGQPDTGGDPDPLQPELKEAGTPNPVPPPGGTPYTWEEFLKKYGFPPRLKPQPVPSLTPSSTPVPVPKPETFPSPNTTPKPQTKEGVKAGDAPKPLNKSAIVPSPVSGGKTTKFQDITKVTTPDGSKVVRVGGGGGGGGGGSIVPPPNTTFEETIKRTLQDLIRLTSEETQITATKTGICQSLQEPNGCAKPILDKLKKLSDDNDEEKEQPKTEDILVTVGKCEETDPPTWTVEEITLTVPKGLGLYVKESLERQSAIAKEVCLADCSPPLPQDYQGKRSNIPPQAIIVYRRLGENAKGYNKIHLPWLNDASPSSEALLPNYTKGQYYGALYYNDNSKFIVYCSSQEEAQMMVEAAISKVRSDKLDSPPRTSYGVRQGMPIVFEGMKATKQYYYPNGRQNSRPAWMRYIKEPE